MAEEPNLVLVRTAWLMEAMGCLDRDPWSNGPPLTASEIAVATPQEDPYHPPEVQSRSWHAGRVRYLLGSLLEPVALEVGGDGWAELEDGYHRLHAVHLFHPSGVIEADVFGFVDELPNEARALPGWHAATPPDRCETALSMG